MVERAKEGAAANADERFMREALKEAEQALRSKDRPVGAVIVHQGQVIARAHHQVKLLRDRSRDALLRELRDELDPEDARLLLQDAASEY